MIQAIADYVKFKQMVALEGAHFFHGHNVARDTIEILKNGELPESLSGFLSEHLPSNKKKF